MVYQFEDCQLDPVQVILSRGGEAVAVEPQVFDLLHCLVERRGRLVTKEELLDEVWGDRFVSESALTSRIKSARRAVGDDGSTQRVIRTIHGKGYCFVASVAEIDAPLRPADGRAESRSPSENSSRRSSLPLALDRLVGRDDVLADLTARASTARLLTIVGTGGVGKTSVALELARRIADDRRDGVALVELVSVRSYDDTLDAVATALDVSLRQDESIDRAIVDLLRSQELLLVMDNCEHLLEPVAELLEQVLQTAPDVTVLATSREPLAINGEQVVHVEPFPVDGLDTLSFDELTATPAVELFVERAKAADARFELTESIAPMVVEICRRLDGIPLALELAASRAAVLDVGELAHRLDERLRLLRAVRRGADPRHSRLLDTVRWSYDLLEPDEQRLFAELAVFAGPFDLAAVETVCGGDANGLADRSDRIGAGDDDVLDLLTRLSRRSMISVRRQASGTIRYEMLETLREFGRSQLDETTTVAPFVRHSRYHADVAEDIERMLQTPDEPHGIGRGDQMFADLRAAQRFAVDVGDVDTALRLITSLREYGMRAMRYEVFSWADGAAALAEREAHPLRPTLTGLRAYGAFVRGEFDRAVDLAERAAADQRDQGTERDGLVERVMGNVHGMTFDMAMAIEWMTEQAAIASEERNPSRRAHAFYMVSIAESCVERIDRAREWYEAAFEAARVSGSPTDLACAWTAKGFGLRGDDEATLDAFAAADRLARSAGNRWMSAFACTEASALRVCMGDLERGCAGLAAAVSAWSRAGEWAQQWLTLLRCVIALERIGRHELAAELLGAVEQHVTADARPAIPTVVRNTAEAKESLLGRLGDERAAELAEQGTRTSVASLVDRTRAVLLGRPESAKWT